MLQDNRQVLMLDPIECLGLEQVSSGATRTEVWSSSLHNDRPRQTSVLGMTVTLLWVTVTWSTNSPVSMIALLIIGKTSPIGPYCKNVPW